MKSINKNLTKIKLIWAETNHMMEYWFVSSTYSYVEPESFFSKGVSIERSGFCLAGIEVCEAELFLAETAVFGFDDTFLAEEGSTETPSFCFEAAALGVAALEAAVLGAAALGAGEALTGFLR